MLAMFNSCASKLHMPRGIMFLVYSKKRKAGFLSSSELFVSKLNLL
jgi:hypothetical protein